MEEESNDRECIIIYDSACPQCSWLMKHMRQEILSNSVISLESVEAKSYYKNGRITMDPEFSDTMIVIHDEEQLLYWKALAFCIDRSDFPKWLKKLVSIIPEIIGNYIYRVLSLIRKLTRKKIESCELP